MRYILDNEGYVKVCSKTEIVCESKTCTAYEGDIPEGYETIEEWVQNANINAYKVVDGQLVYDPDRDATLQEQYENESYTYSTTEKMVGTWSNGKPLYRRVITIPNMGTDWGTHLDDIDYVINVSGYLTSGGEVFPPNMPLGSYGWTATYWTKSDGLLHVASSYSIDGGAIIIEYTKTTD